MQELVEPAVIPPPVAPRGVSERPRERLWRTGTDAIGDAELLSIILGTGVRDHPAIAVAARNRLTA